MTAEEILAMPAGRTMDAHVAELVMDAPTIVWDDDEPLIQRSPNAVLQGVPCYSTSVDTAWVVVKFLQARFTDVTLHTDKEGWSVIMGCWPDGETWEPIVYGKTMPLAVCRTALLVAIKEPSA